MYTVSVEGPSRDVDPAVELLEHVGGTQLVAAVHQSSVTQGDRPDGRTVREGGAPWCRLDRKSGVSGASGSAGSYLPGRCMRSSGRGGKAGTRTGRTPCLPVCLPEWVPVTFCDREPAGMVRRGAHPLSAGLAPSPLTAPRTSSSEHQRGVGGQRRPRGLPPATVQVTTRYPGGLPR